MTNGSADTAASPVPYVTLDLSEALERATRIAADVLRPRAEYTDAQAVWPEEGIRALFGAGLGGLVVSTEHGGSGLGLLATAQVCEALGRECASTALCFGMHLVASAVINARATPEQSRRFLQPISRGEHLTTLALSEPGSGAHFYLPQTRMSDDAGSGWMIEGTKSFVTNGSYADSYVLSTVAADPDAPPGQFSCVMVSADTPGIRWTDPWQGIGMRGNSSIGMALEAVRIPRGNLLGEAGDEIWYVFEVVAPYFLAAMAGTYLGVAAAAFEEARNHLSTREHTHTGMPLSRNQLLQHRIGVLWASVTRCRSLLYHAAALGDSKPAEALLEILAAKAESADTAVTLTNEALTITGGIGFRANSRLSRLMRDARAAHVMAPTTDLLRIWTGRSLLGLPLLSE